MASEKIVTESALAALASDAKRAIYDVLPGGSASGNPCTFDTDIAVPLKSLIANIVASGGNGTPSTPIPIVGHSELNLVRCGVNIWNEEIRNGYYNNTGVFYELATSIANKNPIPVNPNTTYYCYSGSAYSMFVFTFDKDMTFINRITTAKNTTFTTPNNCKYIGFCNGYGEGGTYDDDISFNSDSSDTSYHAYNGQTFTVAFGQTVYGGVYDAVRGKLVVTCAKGVLTGNNNENWQITNRSTTQLVFLPPISSWNIKTTGFDNNLLCNRFLSKSTTSTTVGDCYLDRGYLNLVFEPNKFSNISDVRTWVASNIVEVIYTLATPIEIDVSELSVDTISGVNNIVSDCGGDVEVEYRESVEKYAEEHGGSATSLDSLSDVTLTTPASGDALIYDGAKWANGDGTRHNYSTTEKVVGTWIDGSTLYEKTLIFNNKRVTCYENTAELEHGVTGIGSVKFVTEAYCDFNGGQDWATCMGSINEYTLGWTVGDSKITMAHAEFPNLDFTASESRSYLFTIRYTKAS